MKKIFLILSCICVVIGIIIAFLFIATDEENVVLDIQTADSLSEKVKNIDSGNNDLPAEEFPSVNTNSIPVPAEKVSTNKLPKLKISRLIPDEPCPVDNFDVYVDNALQIFRKNLSDKEKDAALQNVDAIGMPMIMPVIMIALEDSNPEIRSTAIDAIQSLDDPCVIPAVEKAMDDESAIIRQDAVNALLNVDDEGINDALIKAINDADEDVRETAFEVMLMQESPVILPAAEAAVQIKNPDTQKQAISVLEDIPSMSAIDAIINYGLLSDYDEIRDTAAKSLKNLTGEDFSSYDTWVEWWDKNKNLCPENLDASEWAEWWKKR